MSKKNYLVLSATSIEGIAYPCGAVINIDKAVGDEYAKAGQLDGASAASSNAIDSGADFIEHVSVATAKAAAIADLEARIAAAADADKASLESELAALQAS